MAFDQTQVRALSGKLSARHVRTRERQGRRLSYIEGWHAIAEANRIFGYDAWDRQTLTNRCVWQGQAHGRVACAYVARVRVKVRAGETVICREGCGTGQGTGQTPGEAHESALKEAETDAMKRALMTFGNPFGLALYDRAQKGVRGSRKAPKPISWVLLSPEGEALGVQDDPVAFCTALRREIEGTHDPARLTALWRRNLASLEMLQVNLPELTTDKGEHYGAILRALYQHRLRELAEAEPGARVKAQAEGQAAAEAVPGQGPDQRLAQEARMSRPQAQVTAPTIPATSAKPQGPNGAKAVLPAEQPPARVRPASETYAKGPSGAAGTEAKEEASNEVSMAPKPELQGEQPVGEELHVAKPPSARAKVDKAALAIDAPRRVRDKEHLKFVRDQPCLICGRTPSQAHHLRFAQPRALGRKVSDEWVVPLCALHHQSLHTVGDERAWWRHRGIDPVAKAEKLWSVRPWGEKTRPIRSPM